MNKFRSLFLMASLSAVASVGTFAHAQGGDWFSVCTADPDTDQTSAGYSFQFIQNPLFGAYLGVSGTVHYDFCVPEGDYSNTGRIGFGYGFQGSVSSSVDDGLNLTFGWGFGGSGRSGYATIQEDGASTFFGANGYSTTFTGASDTYFFARTTNGNVQIDLRVDLVGDSARTDWLLQNTDTVAHQVGMRFGQAVSMLAPSTGESSGAGREAYITIPGRKPPRVEERFNRATAPALYPSEVNFGLSQENAFGLKVTNDQTARTFDPADPFNGQTATDGFVLGQAFFLLGHPGTDAPDAFPDVIFLEPKSDVLFADSASYIQTWAPQNLSQGSSRRVVSFYSATHTEAVYARPYSVVVDSPKVVRVSDTDPNAFETNPFTVRVWVDNNRGFSTIDKELPLQDVQVQIVLPAGLTAVGGNIKTINRIDARRMDSVDFSVRVDDNISGVQPFEVRVTSTPGPPRTVKSSFNVVSQPRITFATGANLVTSPWTHSDPTWETILGLAPDADFTAFKWDPLQKGYIVSTNAERGVGDWVVMRNGSQINLGGSPTTPADYLPQPDGSGGAPLIVMKPGWNLIGNPYHIAFQIGQITGATGSNPTTAYTFSELVQLGAISGSLAFWDPNRQTYDYIQATTDRMEPHRGYWIYVFSGQDVVFRFPSIFENFVRSENRPSWQQSEKQWRLQLAARGQNGSDESNFIGATTSADSSKKLRVYEPPIAPTTGAISLAVTQDIDGVASRLAQSLSDKAGSKEYRISVDARKDGPVTLTWPNLSTIPKNVRVKLIDVLTSETRDLRKLSGYTYQAAQGLTREFKIQVEQGGISRPVIGAVVATRTGRASGPDAAIRLSYSLSVDATTTIRVLSAQGRDVMTLARGRADRAGQNEIVWNLRDQANRAVAPGAYTAEIVVEGTDGERIRKTSPIVVTR